MKKLLILIVITLIAFPMWSKGEVDPEICLESNRMDSYCDREGDEACQEALEFCSEFLQEVQQEYEEDIERTEQEKRELENQIAMLENRMAQLDQEIRQSELRVQNLESEIDDTRETIQNLNKEIETSKDRLAEMLIVVNRRSDKSTLEILVEEGNLSGFFDQITALEVLSAESQRILGEIRDHRDSLRAQENRLESEVEEAQREAERQALLKQQRRAEKAEHEELYGLTEREYEEMMDQKEFIERRAEEIRERRLALVGLPEEDMPSFEEALEVARWAETQTGVRPAFILAIITQESHLGRNVGECYLTDPDTGAGQRVGGGYVSNLMATPPESSRNDPEKFLKITDKLNKDPYSTPVSCPFQIGYGGAMGPAQFIPTTWWQQREDIKQKLGEEPSPWNLQHSFLASATYLQNLGALQNERRAALRYYAGSNWNDPRHSFYGDQVMRRVNCLQTFIDEETMTPGCKDLVFIPENND